MGIFMKQNIKQANASYLNSNHGQRQESVLFSEILEHIPPADQLSEFFPIPADPYKSDIKPFGLEVLKLRLEGLTLKQISDQLGVSYGRVRYWSQKVKNCLINGHISQRVTVDIPALQRLLRMEVSAPAKYTKLSELLRDMPSDEELSLLDRRYGKLARAGKRQAPFTHQDLYILQQRQAGRTYQSIGQELGISQDVLRRRILTARRILQWNLKIELDVSASPSSAKYNNQST